MRFSFCRTVVLCVAVAMMLPAIAMGGTDKEDAAITDADWIGTSSSPFNEWSVDSSTNKPVPFTNREYRADVQGSLIATHAKSDNGTNLPHAHARYEWGDTGCPSGADANTYWDARFWKGTKTTRQSGAKMKHQTCHEWALTACPGAGGAGGVYLYHLITDYPWGVDVTTRGIQANVAKGDILYYAVSKHSSYVDDIRSNGAGGSEPSILKWKWQGSGVYVYTTPDGHEFSTPMCQTKFDEGEDKDVDQTKTITSQGWSWTVDFRTNPDVYH